MRRAFADGSCSLRSLNTSWSRARWTPTVWICRALPASMLTGASAEPAMALSASMLPSVRDPASTWWAPNQSSSSGVPTLKSERAPSATLVLDR